MKRDHTVMGARTSVLSSPTLRVRFTTPAHGPHRLRCVHRELDVLIRRSQAVPFQLTDKAEALFQAKEKDHAI